MTLRLAATAVLAVGACDAAPPANAKLAYGESIAVSDATAGNPGLTLFRSAALTAWGDHLVLVDGSDKRIIKLSPALEFAGAVGSEGSGPGEFKFALDIAVRGDTVAIGDIGNGRVQFMDLRTGREVRTVRTHYPPTSVAILPDGSVLVPSATQGYYLDRISGNGEAVAFARRPDSMAVSRNTVVRACGEHFYVFDGDEFVLLRYDLSGERTATYGLPGEMQQRLTTERDATVSGFAKQGVRVLSVTGVKMTLLDCRRPVLLVSQDSIFGLVIDTDRGRAHPLMLPENPMLRETLRRAEAVVVLGSRLYVLSDDELWSYAFR